ncbi:MAG: hypothetical protein FWC40_03240 [Proteobacteria bacterium]|nr:hypothetical protein [Pseudomonadota bacterium]
MIAMTGCTAPSKDTQHPQQGQDNPSAMPLPFISGTLLAKRGSIKPWPISRWFLGLLYLVIVHIASRSFFT